MARATETVTKTDDDLDVIRKDLESLRNDVATLTRNLKGVGGKKLDEAREAGSLKVQELQAELERTLGELRRHGYESVASVERTIQDKPLVSLLAAFGAGVLIARLLERR